MAIKYVFAKDAADLEKIQAKAVKSVHSARVQIQIAAIATIKHAHTCGDWTYAQKLVEALGNTVNGAALVEWFKVYGGLKADDNGFSGWSGKDHIEKNFQEAKDKMWWELKVKNPFKGWSLEEALKKVIVDHGKMKEKIQGMNAEEQAKVDMTVNDATIQAVLKLCNFEAIIGEAIVEEEQQAA